MLSSAVAMAEGPSYSYIEAVYQEVDIDGLDGDGFSVAGSVEINESWFVFADYYSADIDAGFDFDRWSAGAGWRSAISDKTDWFATLAFVDAEINAGPFGSASESGLGASIGIRSMFSPKLELAGTVRYSDPEEETAVRAELWYTLTGNFALGLKADFGDDISSYGIGFRLYFDK
jgi:hypothetical protein